eukprot:11438488-Ditylum_brightwellii.AAC.1
MGAVTRCINKTRVQQRWNIAHFSGQMDSSHNAWDHLWDRESVFICKLEQWTKHEVTNTQHKYMVIDKAGESSEQPHHVIPITD